MLYALINPEEQISQTHVFDNDTPITKDGWRWIPIEADPRPPYNPNLQVAIEFQNIEPTRVYRYWQIRDKNENEIDSDKIQKINSIDADTLIVLLDLYNKTTNSSLTIEEYKIYLKTLF